MIQISRTIVVTQANPPAARTIKTLSFFLVDIFKLQIIISGKIKIVMSLTMLMTVSVRKTSSCFRQRPCVTAVPSQKVSIGIQMQILAIVTAIV